MPTAAQPNDSSNGRTSPPPPPPPIIFLRSGSPSEGSFARRRHAPTPLCSNEVAAAAQTMDPLAAAKMKATTTVTLFIIFLIAVGCSSAEVSIMDGLMKELDYQLKDFDGVDPEMFLRHLRDNAKERPLKQLVERLQFHEDQLQQLEQLEQQRKQRRKRRRKRRKQRQIVNEEEELRRLVEKLELSKSTPEKKQELQQDIHKIYEYARRNARRSMKQEHMKNMRHHQIQKHKLEHELQHELQLRQVQQVELPKLTKLQQEKLQRLLKLESEEHLSGVCCKRQMGDIWIAVGLLNAFIFFMVLTFRVFRNLEKQRKSGRKSHAFLIDDLGGVTNLPG